MADHGKAESGIGIGIGIAARAQERPVSDRRFHEDLMAAGDGEPGLRNARARARDLGMTEQEVAAAFGLDRGTTRQPTE